MPSTLEWNRGEDSRDTVHLIVQALVEGKVVALPTETNYVLAASAVHAQAAKLVVDYQTSKTCDSKVQSSSSANQTCLAELMVRSGEEARDFCPELSTVAERFISRGLPGPLSVQIGCGTDHSLSHCVTPELATHLLSEDSFVGLRSSSHDAIMQVMQLLRGPIVVADLQGPEGELICSGAKAASLGPAACDFVVDSGDTHFGSATTTVRIEGRTCQVLRPGPVESQQLNRLGQFKVLVVCTGNTCRSPMAEAILRDLLCKKFPELGSAAESAFEIGSAGISAFPGGPASGEAKRVMARRGLNIAAHQSHSVTEHALQQADLVLTMTHSHRLAILQRLPELAHKIQLVSGETSDVSDPFGCSEAVYAACADQIEGFLTTWVDRLSLSSFPDWQMY